MVNSNFLIKRVEEADIPYVLEMIKELAEFEKLTHTLSLDEGKLTSALLGKDAKVLSFIAVEDSKRVGYAICFYTFSTFLGQNGIYIEDIYVKNEYRNKGYGSRIMKHIIGIAKKENLGRVEWAVLDWNVNAIKFYERMGATIEKEWRLCRITID